jgi:hypothetical protein
MFSAFVQQFDVADILVLLVAYAGYRYAEYVQQKRVEQVLGTAAEMWKNGLTVMQTIATAEGVEALYGIKRAIGSEDFVARIKEAVEKMDVE